MTQSVSWRIGDTFEYWDIPLAVSASPDATVTYPDDLTGVDITKMTLYFRSASSNQADAAGTGTLSVKVTYPAEILYKPSVADVANRFVGWIVIKALYPPSATTADQTEYDPIPFSIVP